MTNAILLMPWGGDKDEDKGMYACHVYPGDEPVGRPICVIRYTNYKIGVNTEGTTALFLYRKKNLVATFLEIDERRHYRVFEIEEEDGPIRECIFARADKCMCDCEDDEDIRYTDDDIKGE